MPKRKQLIQQTEPISIGEALRKLYEIFQEIDRNAVAKRREHIDELLVKIKKKRK